MKLTHINPMPIAILAIVLAAVTMVWLVWKSWGEVDTDLTISTAHVYESESLTPRGPMERTADYRVVERYVTRNRYKGRVWYCTNDFDTGFLVRCREIRGNGPTEWIKVPGQPVTTPKQ